MQRATRLGVCFPRRSRGTLMQQIIIRFQSPRTSFLTNRSSCESYRKRRSQQVADGLATIVHGVLPCVRRATTPYWEAMESPTADGAARNQGCCELGAGGGAGTRASEADPSRLLLRQHGGELPLRLGLGVAPDAAQHASVVGETVVDHPTDADRFLNRTAILARSQMVLSSTRFVIAGD